MRHWRRLLWAAPAALAPGTAFAHASERGVVLLLPTEYYLWAGAAAVAVSFLALAFLPGRVLRRAMGHVLVRLPVPRGAIVVQALAFLAFLGLIYAGLEGTRDPLTNPLPLTVWTLWWVGLTLATAVLGDLWRLINPWSAPMALLRTAGLRPVLRLPQRLGAWPAILWMGGFAWFELVHIAPDDPARLAHAALTYWAATLACMVLFGEEAWRRQGECFALFFRLVARLAPVRLAEGGWRVSLPGAGAATGARLSVSEGLFILATLAGVTFDGFQETFLWLGWIGINPLEFPGRSAVVGPNTLGLIAVWLALSAAFALAVAAGTRIAPGAGFAESFGRLALSLLPIALGYHLAHYFTQLLTYGQYVPEAATDPLGTGADLLGIGAYFVTTSFLYDRASVEAIWQVQSGAIIGGHVLAVIVAHRAALDLHPSPRGAALAEIPLAALMVGYTVLGLWLLSTPTA